MADKNPFDDPSFGAAPADRNPFDDPEFGAPPTLAGEAKKGLLRGIDSTQQGLYGLAALAGKATGIKPVEDFGREGIERNEREAQENPAAVRRIEDISGVKDAALWASGGLGELVPFVGSSMIGAGAGGLALKGVTSAARAATAGAGLTSVAQETGSIAADQAGQGEIDPAKALGYGIAAGALDVIPEARIISKLVGKGAKTGIARDIVTQAALESVTEGGQTALERMGANKEAFSEEGRSEILNAAALGALGGGVIGGAGRVFEGAFAPPQQQPPPEPAPQPQIAGLLPAPGQIAIPAGEGGDPRTPEQVSAEYEAIRNWTEINEARRAEEERQAGLQQPQEPPIAGLLPGPGTPLGNQPLPADAGPFPVTQAHAAQNAADHAASVYSAREAEEERLARFAAQGPISAAAATAMKTGLAGEKQAARDGGLADELGRKQDPLALPEPQGEKEKRSQLKLDRHLAGVPSASLFEAQTALTAAPDYTVVPHPAGGFTIAPTAMLTEGQIAAVAGIQRPGGALPSPQSPAEGFVVDSAGTARAATHEDRRPGMAGAYDEHRRSVGKPYHSLPFSSAEAAKRQADARTAQTGVEHEVVPHPTKRDAFSVREKPIDVRESDVSASHGLPAEDVSATHGLPTMENNAPPQAQDIGTAANEAATSLQNDLPQPTAAQAAAGNYRKGHVKVHGLDVSIENPDGSVRVDKDGQWASAQKGHYGYIRRTKGNDGDKVDVNIGPKPEAPTVFVVNQLDPTTGKFDEHKVMLGYGSAQEAEAAYRANYPADWQGFGGIVATDPVGLKQWLKRGDSSVPFEGTDVLELGTRDVAAGERESVAYAFNSDRSNGVARVDPDSVPELRGKLGSVPMVVADRSGGTPLEAAHREAVAAAVQDLLSRGMPAGILDGVRAFYIRTGKVSAEYHIEGASVGISRDVLDAAVRGGKNAVSQLRGMIAHELSHHEDENPGGYPASVTSPLFALAEIGGTRVPRGKIMLEAFSAWRKGGEFQRLMDYPLRNYRRHTRARPDVGYARAGYTHQEFAEMLQQEVYAQLRRIWYTNPAMLRANAPSAYELFEEIASGEPARTIGAARRALQQALQRRGSADGRGVAVQQRVARADDRASPGDRGRDSGLGVREQVRSGSDAATRLEAEAARSSVGATATRNVEAGREGPQLSEAPRDGRPEGEAGDLEARSRERGRPEEVAPRDLVGDGRAFTDFFTDATTGGRKPNTGRDYTPVIDIGHAAEFSREYQKHRGNFDDHIATSIPGFREVQQAVGNAIVKTYPDGARVLDVGASEGSFIKAISAQSGGAIATVGLDPNPAMAKFFAEHSSVPGSTYEMAAFGARSDEGKLAWTEDDGTEIRTYKPDGKFDVAHEAMTFQFISNARGAQVARVRELLKPDGVALFEQKFIPPKSEFEANEKKKDSYKAQYYSQAELDRKKKDVLEKGGDAAKAEEKAKEEKVVGMHDLMVSPAEFEAVLRENFAHVVQYWDSGNFKGYAASNDPIKLAALVRNIGSTDSEYATTETPRRVKRPEALEVRGDGTDYDIGAERGERETGAARITAEDFAKITKDGATLKLKASEIKDWIRRARETRARFPASRGWAPLELVGLKSVSKPALDGTTRDVVDLVWKRVGYGFNAPLGAERAPAKIDEAWSAKVTSEVVKEIKSLYQRAGNGDKVAANIVAHASWYRGMIARLREKFGGQADFFADLLGAMSPNTPVTTNWAFAIDAIQAFSRGAYRDELKTFSDWIDAGNSAASYPAVHKIRQMSGKLFGMNSTNGMMAMLNTWRNVAPGMAPKARNFAKNLIGASDMATIDVWAARFLRRMADGIRGASLPRIPVPAEKGVAGKWNASATGVTGEFGFGAHVLQGASEQLKQAGIDLTPTDLQAVAWFVEKELWTKNAWTSAQGEGGSFEQQDDQADLRRYLAGVSIQKGDGVTPSDQAMQAAAMRMMAVTSMNDDVVAARALPTTGMYAGTGERSFDAEVTAKSGWDPSEWVSEIARISRENDQVDVIISRVVRPGENNPNARPGVEVYFKKPLTKDTISRVEKILAESGEPGFTLTVDPREARTNKGEEPSAYSGLRIQFVPEINLRYGDEALSAAVQDGPAAVQRIITEKRDALHLVAAKLREDGDVAYANAFLYDTVVFGKENYDEYTGGGSQAGDREAGERSWFGSPVHEGLARAARRHAEGKAGRDSGDVLQRPTDGDAQTEVGDAYEGDIVPEEEADIDFPGFDGAPKRPEKLDIQTGPEPLWESGLAKALDKAPFSKDGKLAGGMLVKWLEARTKDGTIKKDELNHSGLVDYLYTLMRPSSRAELNEKLPITRDDVKAYIDENGVKVEEVVLKPEEWEVGKATKYHDYQLPGGERYRELLLKLPGTNAADDYGAEFRRIALSRYGVVPSLLTSEQYTEAQREAAASVNKKHNVQFRSSHFTEPNILAHVRFNERTDANGKRVLFIEEIQSDWAQKGRKEGFRDQSSEPEIRHNPASEIVPWEVWMNGSLMDAAPTREGAESWAAGRRNEMSRGHHRVQSAPFVTKTEAWVGLALKRMIRYAADNGFDAIAWTTGEQQAERYDLSKQISYITWKDNKEGTRDVTAWGHDHKPAITRRGVDRGQLSDLLGKEIAEKIENHKGALKQLSSLDLKVGGEGMRSFYDKIVPNVANHLLKKMGGGRVGEVWLGRDEQNKMLSNDSLAHAGAIGAAPQPGFSIAPEMLPKARRPQALFLEAGEAGVMRSAQDRVSDYLHTSKTFNIWHKTVGTQHHKAQVDPHFKPVYDGVQNFLNDSSQMMREAADLAPDILPHLDGLSDMFKAGPSKKSLKKVSGAVFDGTIDDIVYTDQQLAARGLSEKEISMYRQVRASIDKSLDEAFASEAVKQARGLIDNDVLARAKAEGNGWLVVDALGSLPRPSGVAQQVYDQLRERAAKLEEMKQNGYAPLMRFGQYTVTVKNADGEVVMFTLHESESEANAMARAARTDPSLSGHTVQSGVLSQEAWKLYQGVSPDALEIFAEALGASESQVFQEYIKLARDNRSTLKRLLRRKKVAGFSDDVQRTLAQFVTSTARAASRNYHWGDVLKAANDVPKEKGDVKDEAARLVQYMQSTGEEAGALRGLLFVQFLGGSVASAMTNATQPVMMTFPYLSQYGGAVKAASRIAAAAKVAAGSAPAEADLRVAMQRAAKEGITEPHEVAGLYAESIRNFGSNLPVRRLLKGWGSLFSLAESFNRKITFVAAYRTAVSEGMANPYEFAVKAIADTQGVYNRGNRPNWARGPVGATLMTFKQYSVAYLEFLKRLPPKERALALAVLALAAGLQGMPGADDAEDVIDTIAESLGYNFNSKKELRDWAVRIAGEDLGHFLVHGFSGLPGVPLDVQARLGLGNLLPGTSVLKRSQQDKGRDVLEFFGPAGGLAQSAIQGFTAAQEGDYSAIPKAALPVAVRNALKGLDMAQTGWYRDDRGRRVIDVDAYEAGIKGLGFQPKRVAEQSRKVQDLKQTIDLQRDVERRVAESWARGIVERDQEAVQRARAELLAWNQTNPEARVLITPAQIQRRVRELLMTREQRFIKATPPELRGQVARELRG